MVSSLWKKLDFTLNQIKSLQNSQSLSACQRIRSRVGLANVARQRALANSSTGVVCTTVSETISMATPAQTSHCILTHSTPVSFSGGPRTLTPGAVVYLQNQDGSRLLNTPKESPVQVTENRLNAAPMSPGRRKWKRSGGLSGAGGSSRPVSASGVAQEEETEEIADENFPQLVIQNARDKILGDRSLQEKLAENINKILASEPTPQTSKTCPNIVEPDQSIDEILGLQAEIHMSDDAIHDILEQTESDPAFQALFDLFEYNKSKTDGEAVDGDLSSCPEEGDLPGPSPSSVVKPCQNVEPGIVQKEATEAPAKANPTDRKTRKSAPVLKKTFITSNRASRIENCSATMLVAQEPHQATTATKRNKNSAGVTPMDIGMPQAITTSAPTIISTLNPTSVASNSNSATPSLNALTSMVSETSNLNQPHANKDAQGAGVKPGSKAKDSTFLTLQTVPSSSSSTLGQLSNSGKEMSYLVSSDASKTSLAITTAPSTITATTSSSILAASTSASLAASSSSLVSTNSLLTPATESNKSGEEPSNIMALNIIISDSQDEDSTTDTALNQAISSISGNDKIPTIYLSSPAKPPAVPGTPKTGLDEVAQAVSGLQRSESVIASPLTGTSQPQQSYFIQVPFDAAAAPAASYFVLTESPRANTQNRPTIAPAPVTKGQAIAPNQFGVAPQRQGFSAGSALILPSPIKPMVLPLSVMGPNVQMVSNQLVAVPNAPVLQQPETVKPKPAGAAKQSTLPGPEKNANNKVPPSSAPVQGAQNATASPSSGHRRILRFDSSGDSQTNTTDTLPSATTSQPLPQPPPRTKPAILTAGSKPKRRIETVRCSDTDKSKTSPSKQNQAGRKSSRKQDINALSKEPSASSSSADVSKPEPRKRSKSTDGKEKQDTHEENNRAKDTRVSRSQSSDSSQKSGSKKDKEPTEKAKSRDSRATEKRAQETTSVTANKENELKVGEQPSPASATAPVHTTSPSAKAPSKVSALVKQATETLHDINTHNSNSPSTPKDSSHEESASDCSRTPVRTRKAREADGTPKNRAAGNSSDLPTCSPASEAGSESSINMAAHTLMILSRAATAMARTGTPLKNSLRQEGAGQTSPATAKNAKKRKQTTPTSSPPAKKEAKRTPSKKKERKKLMECFPQDLDVDKFLSSLHYDE